MSSRKKVDQPEIITNPRRKKRIEDFIDKNRRVAQKYYDLLEQEEDQDKLLREMQKLIEIDPDFYDPYLVASEILEKQNFDREAKALVRLGYEKAMKRIVDCEGNFPKALFWGFLENRHIIRIIDAWAYWLWDDGKKAAALDLFRRLLRSNPHDNIGARHSILSLRLGKKSYYLGLTFTLAGGLDAIKVGDWFEENRVKFPEDFDWWIKETADKSKY